MIFYQDELAKSMPVKHGAPSTLTSAHMIGNIGIVQTILTSLFFEDVSPPPINIVGSVTPEFDSRRLLSDVEPQLIKEKQVKFNVDAYLGTSSNEKMSKKLILISSLVMVIGLVSKIILQQNIVPKYYSLVASNDVEL